MNDNKEIKKLNETGEQSAEKVAGGKGINFEGLHLKDPTPIAVIPRPPRNMIEKICSCADCGAPVHVYGFKDLMTCYYGGKLYCNSCLAKHKETAAEPTTSADAGLSN
ncbi:MAG: hypothetical protein ACI4PJ_02935 [Acutalibacteraceae bacterium]